ncbi:hypothetical protein EKO27_g430 [Xylaria grammica]|uniref:Basic proline-rich protein n=1 Tax=Xylaria grammica TaxID=363999 RepID=A0A439DJU2_9PEZI|nr:hypothetical protein EKO27_g430 [Xylaria grammica]
MEPVPETERMEEFRSSPLPSLRLVSTDLDTGRKPPTIRRSTEPPSPSSPLFPSSTSLPYKPRTTSPLSGLHTRSKSTASITPLSMGRTRSMPGVDGAGRIIYPPQLRPASPSGSPSRQRAPRKPVDEAYPPPSPVRSSVLDSDRQHTERSSSPTPSLTSANTLPPYKRASSPLRHSAYSSPITSFTFPGPPSSGTASPSFRPESSATGYSFSYYPSSSVPSTPSSMRSRSPSISSLETIPDTPDAEEEALEAERIAQLKAAADAAESGDSKSRTSLDVPIRGRTLGVGSRDKRKRWSVCGAERRGDLDLETIWED